MGLAQEDHNYIYHRKVDRFNCLQKNSPIPTNVGTRYQNETRSSVLFTLSMLSRTSRSSEEKETSST